MPLINNLGDFEFTSPITEYEVVDGSSSKSIFTSPTVSIKVSRTACRGVSKTL